MFDPIIRKPIFGPPHEKARRPHRASRPQAHSPEPAIRYEALKWWCLSLVPELRPSVRLALT